MSCPLCQQLPVPWGLIQILLYGLRQCLSSCELIAHSTTCVPRCVSLFDYIYMVSYIDCTVNRNLPFSFVFLLKKGICCCIMKLQSVNKSCVIDGRKMVIAPHQDIRMVASSLEDPACVCLCRNMTRFLASKEVLTLHLRDGKKSAPLGLQCGLICFCSITFF